MRVFWSGAGRTSTVWRSRSTRRSRSVSCRSWTRANTLRQIREAKALRTSSARASTLGSASVSFDLARRSGGESGADLLDRTFVLGSVLYGRVGGEGDQGVV